MLKILEKYWFLVGLALVFAVTLGDPTGLIAEAGRFIKAWRGPDAVIFFIFLFSGFGLNFEQIRAGLTDISGAVIALILIFGAAPLYAALFSLLPIDIALVIGIFLVAVMPTTLSSGVVMSGASGGNPAHALFITVVANCLSVITIAMTLPLLLNLTDLSTAVDFDQVAVMIKIGFYVLLPLSLGLLVRAAAGALIRRIIPVVSIVNQCLVLAIVWMGIAQAKPVLSGNVAAMGRIVVVVVFFHLLMIATAFLAVFLFRIPRGRMESIVFMGSQKTLPLSVILQVTLFPEYGAALIVCVMHHLASLFIDGFLMGRLGSSAAAASQN
ncbi:MAG: bile acid:sodium symporter [Thermodesulfobacteriota bacterium]